MVLTHRQNLRLLPDRHRLKPRRHLGENPDGEVDSTKVDLSGKIEPRRRPDDQIDHRGFRAQSLTQAAERVTDGGLTQIEPLACEKQIAVFKYRIEYTQKIEVNSREVILSIRVTLHRIYSTLA